MRHAFVDALCEIANADPRVVLLTGDLGFMVLEKFAATHPSRFFNVGVAEANMAGLATGLASCGFIPFTYSIATFASMRPYEQIRNGPVLHHLPVRIVGIGGGFEYGHAGLTHAALEDTGIMRIQPGLTVIVPADSVQARMALKNTYALPGPIYYRMGKDKTPLIPGLDERFELGRLEIIREGRDILILSMGSITGEACAAADKLADEGVQATVAVISSFNPAPIDQMVTLFERFTLAITIEAHYVKGGLGSLASEVIAGHGLRCRIVPCGVSSLSNDVSGSHQHLNSVHGLSSDRIATVAATALKEGTRTYE